MAVEGACVTRLHLHPLTLVHPSPKVPPAHPSLLLGQSPSAHITRLTPVLAKTDHRTLHPNHHSSGPGNRDSRHSLTQGNLILERTYFRHDASSPRPHHYCSFFASFTFCSCTSHSHHGYTLICALHTHKLPSVAPSPATGSNIVCSCLTGKAPLSRRSFFDLRKVTGGCTCSDITCALRDFRLTCGSLQHTSCTSAILALSPHTNLPSRPAPR